MALYYYSSGSSRHLPLRLSLSLSSSPLLPPSIPPLPLLLDKKLLTVSLMVKVVNATYNISYVKID